MSGVAKSVISDDKQPSGLTTKHTQMGLKQCKECGEMVDDARAFCPGCGDAFVSEVASEESSVFDRSGETVQFSAASYGDILSEMGLNISEAPNAGEVRVETTAPIPIRTKVIEPSHAHVELAKDSKPVGNSNVKWFFIGGAVLLLLLFLILAVAVIVFMFWSRLS